MYEINIHFSDFAVEEQTKISNRKSDSTVSQLEKVSFGFCLSVDQSIIVANPVAE